jgi:hypothetical protein
MFLPYIVKAAFLWLYRGTLRTVHSFVVGVTCTFKVGTNCFRRITARVALLRISFIISWVDKIFILCSSLQGGVSSFFRAV